MRRCADKLVLVVQRANQRKSDGTQAFPKLSEECSEEGNQ